MYGGKQIILVAAVLAATAFSQDLVLLGDSLSDSGNSGNGYASFVKLVLQTNDTYPEPPYYEGRFSNGPTWVEIAASQLGVGLSNYGAGGATTGIVVPTLPPLRPPFGRLTVPQTVLSPNLFQQLNSLLLDKNNTLSASSYYIILIGDNDFFPTLYLNTTNTAEQTVANIQLAVSKLYAHGARKFVIGSTLTVSGLPVFTQQAGYGAVPSASVQKLDTLALTAASLIQQLVNQIPTKYTGASATYFDFEGAFFQLATNAEAYGLTNIQQACYVNAPDLTASTKQPQPVGLSGGTVCSDPDAHLFWDQVHPSRVSHEFIGASFVQKLGPSLFGKTSPSLAPGPLAPSSALPTLPYLSVAAAG